MKKSKIIFFTSLILAVGSFVCCKNLVSKNASPVQVSEKIKEIPFVSTDDKLSCLASLGSYKLTEQEIESDVVNTVMSLYAKENNSRAVDPKEYKISKVQFDKYAVPVNTTSSRGTAIENYDEIDFFCLPV